jgi:hypothetical protein
MSKAGIFITSRGELLTDRTGCRPAYIKYGYWARIIGQGHSKPFVYKIQVSETFIYMKRKAEEEVEPGKDD